ncbi:MAG: HAD-IA family hydrolase, partial [Planctomycetota bacterium]|nr:HAD-IA family hydrolase [Planctomycetota bacterium]
KEVQFIKLEEAKLLGYFDVVVTSDDVGVQKPNSRVFLHALELASARADESVMIGDDLAVDCHGAIAVGMKAVWFNPQKEVVNEWGGAVEIAALSELLDLY